MQLNWYAIEYLKNGVWRFVCNTPFPADAQRNIERRGYQTRRSLI